MIYKTYQTIILLKETINKETREDIISEISDLINKYAKKLKIANINTLMPLASKINNFSNAWYVLMQFKVVDPGFKKRLNIIEEKLNTYSEVLDYKILEKGKRQEKEQNIRKAYVVYEFDYGDISEGIEPTTTLFKVCSSKIQAEEVAYSLLQEGLEKYYISKVKGNIKNPFTRFNEVELYEQEDEDEQEEPIYYIKIEEVDFK